MLITRPYISPEEKTRQDLSSCGIEKYSRKIVFFVDRGEYEMGICKTGKAIQINLSVETGNISDSMKAFGLLTRNASIIKNAVYKYDVFFPNGPLDLQSAVMILQDAYTVEEINDFDQRVAYKNDPVKYNKSICGVNGKMEALATIKDLDRNNIPLPLYYNKDHQMMNEGEAFSIIWTTESINYEGHQLIDANTYLEIHDLKTYDTMMKTLIQQIQMKSSNKSDLNSVNLISDCFLVTAESLLNGYSFIYDSQMGIGVKSIPGLTSVPYSDFRIKENLASNLQQLTDFIKMEAKHIEKKYGSIRLYYVPLMSGDKLDIKYKDYTDDNQPDFNKTKIDKGYSIEESLVEDIQDLYSTYTDEGADF
jgi:hypothetical protein